MYFENTVCDKTLFTQFPKMRKLVLRPDCSKGQKVMHVANDEGREEYSWGK